MVDTSLAKQNDIAGSIGAPKPRIEHVWVPDYSSIKATSRKLFLNKFYSMISLIFYHKTFQKLQLLLSIIQRLAQIFEISSCESHLIIKICCKNSFSTIIYYHASAAIGSFIIDLFMFEFNVYNHQFTLVFLSHFLQKREMLQKCFDTSTFFRTISMFWLFQYLI